MTGIQPLRLEAPRLAPVCHADDCGLSPGITDAIVACYDNGWLRRTSVVVNGAAWEHAVDAITCRPGLAVALHLNLFEGRPLSDVRDVDLLVDGGGRFSRSFLSLWAHGLTGRRAARLRAQIGLELRRQIERFVEAFGNRGALSIDSHVHYHMIPVVFDELLALSAEFPIKEVRLPREPLYWPLTAGSPRPAMMNAVKNVILRLLSRRGLPALNERSLMTSAAFVGVLGTGAMTLAHVRAALTHLRRAGVAGVVEILFHPGGARPEEASLWRDRPRLQAFYLSPNRAREAALLCSADLGALIHDTGLRESGTGQETTRSESSG
jgi:predicted glycoside hydrolase/deacetylase ChbG (UPF0249 family)